MRSIRPCGLERVVLATPFLAGLLIAGCGAFGAADSRSPETGGLRADAESAALRLSVEEYLVDFTARVTAAADLIAREATDEHTRRAALRWKLNAIPKMREACFRVDPSAALFDAWIMAAQMDAFFSTGDGQDVFGSRQSLARDTSAELLEDIRGIWRQYSGDAGEVETFEARLVRPWVDAHPVRDLDFTRASVLGQFAALARDRGGVVERVRSLDEQVAILSSQARIYLANIHQQIRGEAELMISEAFESQAIATLLGEVGDLNDSANRAALVAERVPDLVRGEREIILDAVDAQRELLTNDLREERRTLIDAIADEREAAFESVGVERAIILGAVADERRVILEAVGVERRALLGSIDAQREETLAWLDSKIERERAVVLEESRRIASASIAQADDALLDIIDLITGRLVLLVVIVVVGLPIVARIYVRVWPSGHHRT